MEECSRQLLQVFQINYDGLGIPVRQLAPGETFG
jgi:hypothetical protein